MSFRITYSMLNADMEEVHKQFDSALGALELGREYPSWIAGRAHRSGTFLDDFNPADTRSLLGRFHTTDPAQLDSVFAAAKKAQRGWADTPWKKRVDTLLKVADVISSRRMELAAAMVLEVGKNRLEALGDVEESADLLRYYAKSWEESNGFEKPLGKLSPNENTRSVQRPFGVFAVIAPFNFPLALTAGMSGAALLGGNSVVLKPSQDAPWCAQLYYECLVQGGLPESVLQLVYGTGSALGDPIVTHPGCDGIAFTGSKEVGMRIYHRFSPHFPKPCLMEMGGKNPAFVCASADLELAVEGCWKSAFGMAGQKCSALSRVYVHQSLLQPFKEQIAAKARAIAVGDPTKKEIFMGPLINRRAVEKFTAAVAEGQRDGKVIAGGKTLNDKPEYRHGHFVEPTVVEAPESSAVFRDEYFAPFLAVAPFTDLETAVAQANRSEYGLTAGIFSREPSEVSLFMDRIESGVLYANRRSGATTGAWPGVQAFCGWKASGSTGKGGCGPYYAAQFVREQSRTIME